MKKSILFTIGFSLIAFAGYSQCSELFISEYVEGSGNNKALEIYNPTGSAISLSGYSVRRYSNGNSDFSAGGEVQLSGSIPAYGTWVIANGQTLSQSNSPACDPALQALADQLDIPYPAPTYMNGNDAITLAKNGVNIDIFGKIGEDPGNAWTDVFPYTDGDGKWITLDHTMIRKSSVNTGVTVNPAAFDPLAQYDTLSKNTWTNLGIHSCVCTVGFNELKSPEVRVFPNPFVQNEELHISSAALISSVELVSVIGQVVYSEDISTKASRQFIARPTGLTSGLYFLRIYSPNASTVSKRILIR
jgi:hypothetical protein